MSENGLHKIPVMRTALEQIQELHTETLYDSATQGRVYLCWKCQDFYPCKTRKLADEALTDHMARTNQGESK